MGRGRLKMELIGNERARKTTFHKRRKGMMKKAYEFSTLCELDVCMIIYGPKLTDRPPELHTWPENPDEVKRIINKYKASIVCKPAKKTYDLSDLLTDRKTKVHVDIYRARKEMYEAKYPTWDERIESLSEHQLQALLNVLDSKLEFGKRTLLYKRNQSAEHHHYHQAQLMEKAAPNEMLLLGGNRNNVIGEPSGQKQPCNYYTQHQNNHDEVHQKPMSSFNHNMVDMQPFPVAFDHHQQHHLSDQMLQFDNSEQYSNNPLAPNPGPITMWMLMASKYNYSTLQFSAGASGSSSQLPPEAYHSNFKDPMIQYSKLENMNMMMLNNHINPPSSSSMSEYYARLVQPALPYLQHPMMPVASVSSHQVQVHASQVKDDQYEDINQYLVMNNRMV